MRIAVCWKWVAVDRDRDSTELPDRRWAGVSAGDRAALEIALRLRDASDGPESDDGEVAVITLGPPEADRALRDAVAAGADRAIRIDGPTRYEGRTVATALARAATGYDLVLTGDFSIDRGTGAVPAFMAADLGAAQALGLVDVATTVYEIDEVPTIRAVRRLDGGRREVLDVPLPAVMSVEGSAAKLRRAHLQASLTSGDAAIQVLAPPAGSPPRIEVRPYRPRPRVAHAPSGGTLDRIRELLQIDGADEMHAETVTLDPSAAARRIITQLTAWGYIDPPRLDSRALDAGSERDGTDGV
ncbi:MAG: mycofactocin-associated electron transfer flavoprotein beta subunit [Acidimicrobiia bacterium]|nr:mycofactocin-associated electron transfer flavoprotein beta subunit [Acidimicrobiia bacterium]